VNKINHSFVIQLCSLFFLLSFSIVIQAKNSSKLKLSDSDTVLINSVNKKAFSIYRSKPDSALILAHQSLHLSERIKYKKGTADAYNTLAYTHLLNIPRNDSAQYYYTKAFDLYQNLDDVRGMAVVYYGLGYLESFKGNLKESEILMKKSLKLFNTVEYKRGIYNTYHALSYIYKEYKDYNKSEEYINLGIKVAEQTTDISSLADLYNTKGNLYKDQALFEHAIDIYFKALNLWESEKDSLGLSIAYGSIGNMYYFQKDYKKALHYFFKKLPISIRTNNNWEESKTYNSIASVYNAQGKNDSALFFMKKSLQLNLMLNFPSGIADSYHNLANTYYLISSLDSALYYINKSIIIAKNIYDRAKLAGYYILRGKIYLKSGNEQLALKELQEGYFIAKELKIPFDISDAANLLSKIYADNSNYQEAYYKLLEHKSMQDSLNKDENIKKITQLELQYAFDKKQHKIELEIDQERLLHRAAMKQQRMFLLGLSILLIFLILLSILIFRQRNLRAKFKTIELEQKLLRTQMNPHFIFNSLCAIQEYMYNNKTEEAGNFLSRFASLMRQILENSRTEYVTIENEINMLNHYLEIQMLRFDKKFTYEIVVDDAIDKETYAIPPMLAQPFIENAIEHGLMQKKEAGKIIIRLQLQNELLCFEVEDNGIGRKQSMHTNNKDSNGQKSLATMLTQERLEYLKVQTGKNIFFQIDDLMKNNKPAGTRVTIRIPYQKIYS
jgi:tetratricopeptide (TPR) repeat protein